MVFPPYYRHPKTTQEQKANERDAQYVRGKRSPHNLPNAWDDKHFEPEKGWKSTRKTQNRVEKRGRRHYIILSVNTASPTYFDDSREQSNKRWAFEDYCKEHQIPYSIVKRRKGRRWLYILTWWSNKKIGIQQIIHKKRW